MREDVEDTTLDNITDRPFSMFMLTYLTFNIFIIYLTTVLCMEGRSEVCENKNEKYFTNCRKEFPMYVNPSIVSPFYIQYDCRNLHLDIILASVVHI